MTQPVAKCETSTTPAGSEAPGGQRGRDRISGQGRVRVGRAACRQGQVRWGCGSPAVAGIRQFILGGAGDISQPGRPC